MPKLRQKPKKPRPDFPLSWHPCGQWVKKIRRKLYYFGTDPFAAEQKYLDEREYLQAGRTPPATTENGCGLADMVNYYLSDAKARVASRTLSPLSYRDYKWTGEQLLTHFGRGVDPTLIVPLEFAAFRNDLAARYAPSRLTKTVTVTKMMFNWAFEMDIIDRPPKFGKGFKGAPKKVIRKRQNENPKSFDREELKALIDAADPTIKTMILVAINCAFGNTDISSLPQSAIEGGWVNFPRPKTANERRANLWPETISALDAMPRPTPKDEELADRVFLTSRGAEWVTVEPDGSRVDKITLRFRALMKDVGCYRKGRSFYGLRHTFESVAGNTTDQVTVDAIMGHADESMAARYRSGLQDKRLRTVTNHVRRWLFQPDGDETGE